MNITEAVNIFRNNISHSWSDVGRLLSGYDGGIDDWLQANWESIVESHIYSLTGEPIFLEVYGSGADCNPKSSRHCLPEKKPTHFVRGIERPRSVSHRVVSNSHLVTLHLDQFGTLYEGIFFPRPPFDYAKLRDGNSFVFLSAELFDWEIVPVGNNGDTAP